jgi:hypothetical protein
MLLCLTELEYGCDEEKYGLLSNFHYEQTIFGKAEH